MNLICTVCGAENEITVKSCIKCRSQKFIEQKDDTLLPPGQVIAGRYKIIGFLNAGGMGAVYKAEDNHLSKFCAIKELISMSSDEEDNKKALIRFDREARLLSALRHADLPMIIDYFSLGNRHYLVMEYIDGEDLESILNKRGSNGLTEEDVVKLALEICDVLDYLHNRDPVVIYRDIKPSNIMIRKSDQKVILIDFGIARTLAPEHLQNITITAVGTTGYMSPEQYRGKPEPRSDIYSLGATMHHLLTGNVPMPFTFEPLEEVRPDLSDNLKAVVAKALSMKISERFRSVMQMKEALMRKIKVELPEREELTKLDLLLNQLTVSDPDWRYIVIRALKSHSDRERMLEPLLKVVLNDPDLIVRREAAEFLSTFEDKRIVRVFNILMTDRDLEIRQKAMEVMERFKDRSSCESLLNALSDKDQNISVKAAICLLKIGEEKFLGNIFEFFKKQTDSEIQSKLVEAINDVSPTYLNEWRREKEEKTQETKKKGIKNLLYVVISIIIVSVMVKVYMEISMVRKYNNLMDEGKKLLENYDYNGALLCFTEAMKIRPNDPETLYLIGKTSIPLDQKEAGLYLDKSIFLKKDYPEALMAKGKLYLVENNFKESINYLEKAIKLKDDLPVAYIYLGESYYKSGDKLKAEEMFNRALASKDDDTVHLGNRWLKKIESDKLSQDKKQKIELLLEKGKNSIDNQNYPAAGIDYQEIITISPEDSRGYSGLGKANLLRKNFTVALEYLNKAIEFDPLCKEAFYNTGYIYLQQDDYNQSIKYLNMALNIDPLYPPVHYLKGLSYYKKGKKEEALKEFNTYITLAPSGEYAEETKNFIKEIDSGK